MIPPVVDYADSPTVQASPLNSVWLGYVLGALEGLTKDSAWVGTESEIFDATQNIESIMKALAVGGGATMSLPVGTIMQYAGSTAPDGWLVCDGTSFDPATYADLFAVLGTTYGGTSGAPLLPDFRGRAPIGVGTGSGLTARTLASKVGTETQALTTSQLPSHTHAFNRNTVSTFDVMPGSTTINVPSNLGGYITGSQGSGSAHNNMQPSLAVNFIIKY